MPSKGPLVILSGKLALSLASVFLSTLPALAQDHPIVTDGDTLKFGNVRVRLYSIDAPEGRQTCDDGAWPAGKIAIDAPEGRQTCDDGAWPAGKIATGDAQGDHWRSRGDVPTSRLG
jgi:endonuclease YncB( thermonuclease family)